MKPAEATVSNLRHTNKRGADLLGTPLLNKGTAFSVAERDTFGLHGLLPPHVLTLDDQIRRNYEAYRRQPTDLDRHVFLCELQERNEVLFYALLRRHIAEMLPMIYAPVVAQGCQHFSHIYRKPRGLFLSYPLRHRMREMLANRLQREVSVIVVTDGERVLSIGDQGVGGMGIPIGKLTLYSLLGGVYPGNTLPILLDVGTNNVDLRNDPLYLGWRNPRIDDDDYWAFIEEFVGAVKQELPNVLLQWEDFAKPHARPILDKYADQLCTFNDDIQGTAAVALGTVQSALRVAGRKLSNEQVVIFGAGGAGTGVADYLRAAMIDEGLGFDAASRRFWLIDADGLLNEDMQTLSPVQRSSAQPRAAFADWSCAGTPRLADVVANGEASILIGTSAQPGQFTESIVKAMAARIARPIIFPLSNPGERAEAKPTNLLAWTDGRALIATGSPFAPVEINGRKLPIPQSNNLYIFPAIGLAVTASGARRVTDGMLRAGAAELAYCSPALQDKEAPLLPPVDQLESLSMKLALAAQVERHAPTTSEAALRERIEAIYWRPVYRGLEAIE